LEYTSKYDEPLSKVAFNFDLRHYAKAPLFDDLQILAHLEVDVEYEKDDFTFKIVGQMQYDKFNSLSNAGLSTYSLPRRPPRFILTLVS
jgi:hypothetical protein